MNPEFRKVALIVAVLGLIVALFVALRSGGDDGSTTTSETRAGTTTTAGTEPITISISVAGGRPTGGIQRITLTKGERAALVVASDVADEIHIHGYDLSADVEAGGSVRIPFTADIVGRFEVELEQRGVQLAEIEVTP